jgi:glycosyltransferase involved in cell wall biosynthesis
MADPLRKVVLIADRVANPDQIRSVTALVDRLARRGWSARVICSYWGDPDHPRVEVTEAPGLGDGFRRHWAIRGLRDDDGFPTPELLHVLQSRMAPAGLEIAERWRVPYLQGIEEFLPPGARLRLSRMWCRGLIATSRELSADLIRNCGVPAGSVRIVHRGIATAESFGKTRDTAPSNISIVGAAGPLTAGSGFGTYLNAARRVLDAGIDAEFILVGQGEDEDELRRRAERLRIADRVTFAGDAAVGLSFWDILDVYCQPSTVPTVGRNLARALAHGLATVASDIEGLRSLVVHNGTGLRVPPGDTNALSRAILDLLADRALAERLGRQGCDVVSREYELEREAVALAELYEATVDDASVNRVGLTASP